MNDKIKDQLEYIERIRQLTMLIKLERHNTMVDSAIHGILKNIEFLKTNLKEEVPDGRYTEVAK